MSPHGTRGIDPVDARLKRLRGAARLRSIAQATLLALPWLLVVAVLAWRVQAAPWSLLLVGAVVLAAAIHARHRGRGFDDRWLARQLNARRRDMEDSADLLFAHAPPRTPLEQLQLARLRERVQDGSMPDLRAPWPTRRLLAGAALAAACIAAIVLYPAAAPPQDRSASTPGQSATATRPPRLVGHRIYIQPPAYTGLPTRTSDSLAARVPEGATLEWHLHFTPVPEHATLVFHDGERLQLQRDGDAWVGSRRLQRSALYRIETGHPLPAAQAGPHRLDVITDKPPQLQAVQPRDTLTLLEPGQRTWTLEFDARDDYGLAATARLRIIRTRGSGESINTEEQVLTLHGQGDATHKRYRHRIDVAALDLAPGEDLIARLDVADNREPEAQTTRSPSFILRRPPDPPVRTTDLEGVIKRIMPAYFRSQRQIIIDAEALLAQKPQLAPDQYLARSARIGADQRLLRLRHGRFLGMETEEPEAPEPLLPTNDAQDLHGDNDAATGDHGHAGGAPGRAPSFGEEQAILEQYGHTHDLAEATTLLDPRVRKLLKAALDEMWQSELNLRQGRPDLALPYANRALGLIKQVQQAERIYLPRVGTQLPPIDFGRRLEGDREGLGDRRDPLEPAASDESAPVAAWRALSPLSTADPGLDALADWIDSRQLQGDVSSGVDPLELVAAIAALRGDPDCGGCRERLRDLLWPLLPQPTPANGTRPSATRAGQAYLDALGAPGPSGPGEDAP